MLYFVFGVLIIASLASCRPQAPFFPRTPIAPQGFIPIVSQIYDLNPLDNSYNFRYESADGSSRQEAGVITNPGTAVEASAVTGSYAYIAPDGTPITVNYVADENGFQPVGTSVSEQVSRTAAQQAAKARAEATLPGFLGPQYPGVVA
ncbi:endocuticle structural glycoprotein SgAbd-9-like [Bacillus rossius redtenbacheri]|uniref:endocuticle structural glycoprotein SgAbd-9-like n=1 Tax=Bacillus rossius redtenbacheri TaxID=93214 RepID=UPI002FDED1BA